jgi:cytochrome c-type biogenesis protein CcmH/NrfG
MSYTHYSESQMLKEALQGKPQNYKLAYLLAYAAAKGGSETHIHDTFKNTLRQLDEADKTHPPKTDQ